MQRSVPTQPKTSNILPKFADRPSSAGGGGCPDREGAARHEARRRRAPGSLARAEDHLRRDRVIITTDIVINPNDSNGLYYTNILDRHAGSLREEKPLREKRVGNPLRPLQVPKHRKEPQAPALPETISFLLFLLCLSVFALKRRRMTN